MSTSARVLQNIDVCHLISYVDRSSNATRNRVIVLLSFKSGLRASEIAGLDWSMVLTPAGKMSQLLSLGGHITKGGSSRRIPIHPDLHAALSRLHHAARRPRQGPVIMSARGSNMRPRSIVNYFAETYAALGFDGCSSHSGRRTFITQSAKVLARSGGSLRDIQELAGHRSLTTTERYIQGDRDAQRRLVSLI